MHRLIYIASLVCSFPALLIGQNPEFLFSNLGEKNGLSDNIVNCFLQDSRGIMWIGTYNGLNSFDGSNFQRYKKRKGKNSLVNEVIHSLCEDRDGRIWAATDNGVFCYDPVRDVYINYQISQNATANSYFNIRCDLHGNVLASSSEVLYKYNNGLHRFDSLFSLVGSDGSVGQIRKNGVRVDTRGDYGIWMATSSGIVFYNSDPDSIISFRNAPENPLFHERSASALFQSPQGAFWFCDNSVKEIIAFDPIVMEITRRIPLSGILDGVYGATIFVDAHNRLWFCNWNYEILVFDLDHHDRVTRVIHHPDDPQAIASEFFWDAYQDADGTIWLGTTAGISRCNPERNIYTRMHLPELIPALNESTIVIVGEDPVDGSLWCVTTSEKLIRIEPGGQSNEVIDLSQTQLGRPSTLCIREDHIIITTRTGAWTLKKGMADVQPYADLPMEVKASKCIGLAFVGDSVQWSTDGTQLYYWNLLQDLTRTLHGGGSEISLLTPDGNGQLWFVLDDDVLGYVGSDFRVQSISLKQHPGVVGVITSIDPTSEGKVWVNIRGSGLYCYDILTKQVTVLDETDGLTSSRMQKTITDEKGRVWSMFYHKIAVWMPEAPGFYHFGLPFTIDRANYVNAVTRRKNGHLVMSVANDLIELFPERLAMIQAENNPRISRVIVRGREMFIQGKEHLILPYAENTLKFEFGTLTDKEFFPFAISYRLDGVEDQWSTADQAHEALYHNLSPGEYTFRVKSSGQNQYWSSEEETLDFTIKRPWYRTIWFIAFVTITLAGLIGYIYRYRIRQKERLLALQGKAQALEKEKAVVMYDILKQQLNPHFLFNSLTSLSGLIELDQGIAGNFLEQLSGIYRYILKNGDQELVSLKEELEFVHMYIDLQKTRFKEGLQFRIDVPDEYLYEKIAPVSLQNMIENAIKHNIIDTGTPLIIEITADDQDYVVVRNNFQRKTFVETSNKKGLAQFVSLYRYLTDRPVVIHETETHFEIRIPLI